MLQEPALVAEWLEAECLEVLGDVVRRFELAGTRCLPAVAGIVCQPIGMIAKAIAFDELHARWAAIWDCRRVAKIGSGRRSLRLQQAGQQCGQEQCEREGARLAGRASAVRLQNEATHVAKRSA